MGAVQKATGERPSVQGWWADFLSGFAIPNVELFNDLVPWGEFLVGIGLLLGCLTTFAALMGVIMNFAFLFSGTISTNPQMVLLTMFILVTGANAGKFGLDYYVLPYIRKLMKKEKEAKASATA
jgi:thiosulfate dehydrogenase [quinone] large subunit